MGIDSTVAIDPTVVTFLLVFVPVVLLIGFAFLLVKLAEKRVWSIFRLIGKFHRPSARPRSTSRDRSEHSEHSDLTNATTIVNSTQDVEKGQAVSSRKTEEA